MPKILKHNMGNANAPAVISILHIIYIIFSFYVNTKEEI